MQMNTPTPLVPKHQYDWNYKCNNIQIAGGSNNIFMIYADDEMMVGGRAARSIKKKKDKACFGTCVDE